MTLHDDFARENDILQLAEGIIAEMMTIVDESPEVKALSDTERALFFRALADAFNDSTDE